MIYNSLYGNYRTRTFADIFDDYDTSAYPSSEAYFEGLWSKSVFNQALRISTADGTATTQSEYAMNPKLVFALLYANYGNSSIASSDENRFLYQLHSIMFQYGPTWARKLHLQKEIREISLEQAREGNRTITNLAENPSVAPSTLDTEEIDYVNSQNVTKSKRSLADGAALITALLQEDVTQEFISQFRKLFLTVVAPECPLWYVTEDENVEE